ncbi:MAG TPA: serine hydrolase domain-containing protein [Xanthobacteraceae bacterium]
MQCDAFIANPDRPGDGVNLRSKHDDIPIARGGTCIGFARRRGACDTAGRPHAVAGASCGQSDGAGHGPARTLGRWPSAHRAQDLDTFFDGLIPYGIARGDIAGADLVVVKDGKILFARGYGYADVAKRTPVDPSKTLFRIASISKTLTWTAIM